MSVNEARHISQAMKKQKVVYLAGTASTTYYKGEGVAYNRDYGTATEREGERDSRVEILTQSNNLRFAGVLDSNVSFSANETLKRCVINEPGSVCDVAIGSDTVVDTTILTALAACGAPGRFRSDAAAELGRGCALALQTTTAAVTGESIDGTAVVNGTAVVDTGLFTDAVAGDELVIMASATSAGAAGATAGIYTIATVTDDDNAVLSTSASSAASEFAGFVMSPRATDNATCLAYLYDGKESGLIEWIECLNNAASQSMVGGCTHILGGVTLASGDCTSTLADGTVPMQSKGFVLHGALTTQDYLLTVTSGLQSDGSSTLANLEFDADGDMARLDWFASEWQVTHISGPTEA